ncbi:hypothetical protein HA402_014243 [Bradysia odoriphaga]|nr:hypothetical protein HA402_014243 [Bradysia odoriphaga]
MKSFVPVDSTSDFSIHNLPYGVFSDGSSDRRRIGVAIGDYILDLSAVAHLYPSEVQETLKADVLNLLMGSSRIVWQAVRCTTQHLLFEGSILDKNEDLKKIALIPQSSAKMHLPANIGDYTDFYSSIHHATNGE